MSARGLATLVQQAREVATSLRTGQRTDVAPGWDRHRVAVLLEHLAAAVAAQPDEDTLRLDWVIRQADEFSCGIIVDAPGDGDYLVGGMGNATGQGKTGREAIDAARGFGLHA